MQALVKYAKGPGLTEIRDLPIPQPPPGEVLVRVHAAAVCASDVHLWHDSFTYQPPLVLGHEFAGTVHTLGDGVTSVQPGDRVVSENNPQACGSCRICTKGWPNLCPHKQAIGFKRDGCFADYLTIPASLLHRLPGHVSFRAAALAEPLAVATHAVHARCGIEPGDTVVVLGPGAIGLLAALVARAEGAGTVIIAGTDRDTDRLACAANLGLLTANVQQENLTQRLLDLTDGFGADVVVEAAGAAPAINTAADLVRRAGRVVAIGITGKPSIDVAWDTFIAKGVQLAFSYSSRRPDWQRTIGYLRDGSVPTEALITGERPLSQWQDAFHQLESLQSIRTIFNLEQP